MKRFLIPAMIFVDASAANVADLDVADLLIAFNQSRTDNTRIHVCEFSETTELEDGIQPTDLSEHPTRGVKAELEDLQKKVAELSASLEARTGEVRDLHQALGELVDECETNSDFADHHESEVEALENARIVHERIAVPA